MKALASDFDGTLFFLEEGGFREDDLKAIKKFQKEGHLFGICTGRPLEGTTALTKDIIDFDYYIVSSGAMILDKNYRVLYKNCMSRDIMTDIYNHYKDEVNVFIQANHSVYAFDVTEMDLPQIHISSLDEIEGDNIFGVSINAINEENAHRICQEIKRLFDVDAFQNKEFIDVVPKNCSKGLAIQKAKELLNINIIAGIGDNYNDLPMLEMADYSFTFHESPNLVKEKANSIVSSVKEAIQELSLL